MSERDDGGSAFPGVSEEYDVDNQRWRVMTNGGGMTLRDYFAAKAMQACVTACASDSHEGKSYCEYVATVSYEMADAMLKARQA